MGATASAVCVCDDIDTEIILDVDVDETGGRMKLAAGRTVPPRNKKKRAETMVITYGCGD